MKEGVYHPSWGFRFATKLPNASNESGIGLDTTNFYASVLGAKTINKVRLVGNLGWAMLGDPTRGDRQNDVLTYGASFARALTPAIEAVGEVNGHVDTRERAAAARNRIAQHGPGGRAVYTFGEWRADARDAFRAHRQRPWTSASRLEFTYVFEAFNAALSNCCNRRNLHAGLQGTRLRQRLPAGAAADPPARR